MTLVFEGEMAPVTPQIDHAKILGIPLRHPCGQVLTGRGILHTHVAVHVGGEERIPLPFRGADVEKNPRRLGRKGLHCLEQILLVQPVGIQRSVTKPRLYPSEKELPGRSCRRRCGTFRPGDPRDPRRDA